MTTSIEQLVFCAIAERQPGPKWQAHFRRFWPAYHEWFMREGDAARPAYAVCARMLREHLPRLVEPYERMVDLAGGGDAIARFLSLWCPTPYLAGCSQAIWTRGEPALVRNYDYAPNRCDGIVMHSAWTDRRVIASTDCMWGALDGLNDAGLSGALAFGGRPTVGKGFGAPLVLRYVLETCDTVAQATDVLCRVPVHMTYNVALADAAGDYATVYVGPDRPAAVKRLRASTNHQDRIEWRHYAEITETRRRRKLLDDSLDHPAETLESLTARFLERPLFRTCYDRGWGTLYTAVYRPRAGTVEYRWPDQSWLQSFEQFTEGEVARQYA